MTKTVTIAEFAHAQELDYIVASSLIKFLVKIGAATEKGKKAMPEGQRGKPSVLFELPNVVELVLWDEGTVESENPATIEEKGQIELADRLKREAQEKLDTETKIEQTNDAPEMAVEAKEPVVEIV